MSVDLATFVPLVKAAVDAPGSDSFADSVTSDWVLTLRNAFWDARLDGFLGGWQENADNNSPGIITPVTGSTDIPRDLIQLVIFYAAMGAIVNQIRQLRTQFKAQAGVVSFEYQQSANALRDVLKTLTDRRAQLFEFLSAQGVIGVGISDALYSREISMLNGETWWEGSGSYDKSPYYG